MSERLTLANGEQVELSDMIDNPEKYGFKWGYGSLKTDDGSVEVSNGPTAPYRLVTPESLTLFISIFGAARVVGWMNSSSVKVTDQKLRKDLINDLPLRRNDREMKANILRRAFGVVGKSRQIIVEKIVEKRVYLSEDGNFESDDKEQVIEYNKMAREADTRIQ